MSIGHIQFIITCDECGLCEDISTGDWLDGDYINDVYLVALMDSNWQEKGKVDNLANAQHICFQCQKEQNK